MKILVIAGHGRCIISQQAVDQFVRNGHCFAFPLECSSFLQIDRLHKSSYTPRSNESLHDFLKSLNKSGQGCIASRLPSRF